MQKGTAFVIVGHSHWGKSRTLLALSGNRRDHFLKIKGAHIVIKRMSNDDNPKSLSDFLNQSTPKSKYYILFPLCPNFADPHAMTMKALKKLTSKYIPYFFVLKKRYSHDQQVSPAEIKALRTMGKARIFKRKIGARVRAKALRQFIVRYI